MKARRHEEGGTIEIARDREAGFGIFDRLQCREAEAENDGQQQAQLGALAVVMLQRMVSPGDGGAREQQDQRIHQGDVPWIEGLDARWRPGGQRRIDADFMEDRVFEKDPEPGDKEHHFRRDEHDHAVAQADIHHRRVITAVGFLDHIAPPADHRIDDHGEAEDQTAPCAIGIEDAERMIDADKALHIPDSAKGEKEYTQRADKRPRARIDQVVIVLYGMPSHRESPATSNQSCRAVITATGQRFNAKARHRLAKTQPHRFQKTYRTG